MATVHLIGYEHRLLAREDFNDDTGDAGGIDAGHTVALPYELIPVGAAGLVDLLHYSERGTVPGGAD